MKAPEWTVTAHTCSPLAPEPSDPPLFSLEGGRREPSSVSTPHKSPSRCPGSSPSPTSPWDDPGPRAPSLLFIGNRPRSRKTKPHRDGETCPGEPHAPADIHVPGRLSGCCNCGHPCWLRGKAGHGHSSPAGRLEEGSQLGGNTCTHRAQGYVFNTHTCSIGTGRSGVSV